MADVKYVVKIDPDGTVRELAPQEPRAFRIRPEAPADAGHRLAILKALLRAVQDERYRAQVDAFTERPGSGNVVDIDAERYDRTDRIFEPRLERLKRMIRELEAPR